MSRHYDRAFYPQNINISALLADNIEAGFHNYSKISSKYQALWKISKKLTGVVDTVIAETKMYPEFNTIFISLHGFAEAAETEKEVNIFEASLPTLPIQEMSLIIDCNDMAIFKPDILPLLERCYKMYNGFKNAILVNPTKMVAKGQLQRVATAAGFTGHFVDSAEEAWEIVKS